MQKEVLKEASPVGSFMRNKKIKILSFLLTLGLSCGIAFAADDIPSLSGITVPIIRFLNALVLFSGGIFVILVLLTAIKFAMSQGDPKGIEGAKQALTYAILGFLAVIGVYVILQILVGGLGAKEGLKNPQNIFDAFQTAINGLLEMAGQGSSNPGPAPLPNVD